MPTSRVLKLDRDDAKLGYVLLHITQTGSKPLDIKLAGTEGEAAYVTTLKNERVDSLRVKNCPVSESEWEIILQCLLQQKPIEDIHATASVQSETSLSITVRKQVQGITQRLGSITLRYSEVEEIELFNWCAVSADALVKSNDALVDAAAHVEELNTTVTELKAQLNELVAAKQGDETALLRKFRDLLNEKKVKIREQQKILSSGLLQEGQQSSSQQPHPPEFKSSRQPAPSRSGKRKAHAKGEESGALDEDEMELDKIKSEPEETDPGIASEATASGPSDTEDEGVDDNTHPKRSDDSDSRAGEPSNTKKQVTPPPAPRSLPFARKKAAAPPTAGSETDSDDEL